MQSYDAWRISFQSAEHAARAAYEEWDRLQKLANQYAQEAASSALKLSACEKERDEWQAMYRVEKANAENMTKGCADLARTGFELESRLQECQKYWDDEKRRYDAADKAFRLVCDERDNLSSRLDSIRAGLNAVLVDNQDGNVSNADAMSNLHELFYQWFQAGVVERRET